MTDATFERIEDDERPLGPKALLLSGFAAEEIVPLEVLLLAVGAPEHRLIRCSREILDRTLAAALEEDRPGEPAAQDQLPRVAILSGLTGRQIHALIDGFRQTGLARPIWAAATEHSLGLTVKALLMELLNEQRAMAAKQGQEKPGA